MAGLQKGINVRFDKLTGEIFYDVELKHRGKVVAKQTDFPSKEEAEEFYFKHLDKQNIQRIALASGAIRYKAEFYRGVKAKPLKKTFHTFNEAVTWRRLCRERGDGSNPDDKASWQFMKFSDYWMDNEVKTMRSPNTIKSYEGLLSNHVYPILGKIKLINVKKTDINELVSSMVKKKKSPGTINMTLAMVGRCFSYAWENEIIDKNIMHKYKKVAKQAKQGEYWESGDIAIFLAFAQTTPYYELFYTALRSGMRKGEILGLKWDAVNFHTEQITVKRNRTQFELREITKSKKSRIVPMVEDLMVILKGLKKKNKGKESDYVFVNPNGSEINYQAIGELFNEYQRKSGVSKRIRFHDLRHTFASQYSLMGGNIERLQKLLGHSDMKMTQIYSHLNEDYLMQAREHIEKLKL